MITFTSYENFKPKNDNTSFDISYSSTDPTDPIDGLTESFGTTIVDSGLTSPISASNGSGNSNTVSVSVMEGYSDSSSTQIDCKPSSDVTYHGLIISTHSSDIYLP